MSNASIHEDGAFGVYTIAKWTCVRRQSMLVKNRLQKANSQTCCALAEAMT